MRRSVLPAALVALLSAAAPVPGVEELRASAKRLSEVKLEEHGQAKVEAVRRRLGALAALAGAARPFLRGQDVAARLSAHLALAEAHEAFARELFAVKAPAAARGEAAKAWAEQVQATVERALGTARAHLRSCVDLAAAAKAPGAECAAALRRVGEAKSAKPGDAAALVRSRTPELQPCLDARAAERPEAPPIALTARLSVDALGRVEDAQLSPRREEERALYDCLSDALWIWTFPGVSEVELEVPLAVGGGRP